MEIEGIRMGRGTASRRGTASGGSLADAGVGQARVELGDAGRRCALCRTLLARMNRDTLCFVCQGARDAELVRSQGQPMRIEEMMRRPDPLRLDRQGRRRGL